MGVLTQKIAGVFRFLSVSFLIVAMLYLSFIGIKNISHYNRFNHELADMKAQLQVEEQKFRQLSQLFEYMSDPHYWDLQARRNLGYTKRSEKVFKFVYSY